MDILGVKDSVVQSLRTQIIIGDLAPGQKLNESALSSLLGISRPPLREAFKILEAEGLIRREPRRGVFVSELKDGDIWEIYTLKLALYTLGVTLAMDKITNGEVEKLEKVVAQMEKSALGGGSPDVMKYEELNNLFHEMTANIAGHTRLKKIQQSLNNQIKRIAYRSFGDRKHLEASCKYHRKILDAIKDKDKARAEQLTKEHILKGLEVQEKLKRLE